MTTIADEKYVRLTTFTKDGRRKETPVWVADLGDGRVGFTTELDSWKVKRISRTPSVELTPSNMRGVPQEGAIAVPGTATVVTGADLAPVASAIRDKYGVQVSMVNATKRIRQAVGKLRGRGDDDTDAGIVITLE